MTPHNNKSSPICPSMGLVVQLVAPGRESQYTKLIAQRSDQSPHPRMRYAFRTGDVAGTTPNFIALFHEASSGELCKLQPSHRIPTLTGGALAVKNYSPHKSLIDISTHSSQKAPPR